MSPFRPFTISEAIASEPPAWFDAPPVPTEAIQRGWTVLPVCLPYPFKDPGCYHHGPDCPQPGKRPLIPWKDIRGPSSKEQLETWKREFSGGVNWAIRTGQGLLVLDFDSRDAVEAFEAERGALPETLTCLTRRGLHLYFSYPPELSLRSTTGIWPHVDVRADGGIVIIPPSRHASRRAYHWLEQEAPVAEAPGWLIERLLQHQRANGHETGRRYQALAGGIAEGQRNATLTSLAGLLRRAGLDAATIETTLQAVNKERCSPPLPPDEVARIARGIERYPPAGAQNGHAVAVPDGRASLRVFTAKELCEAGETADWLWHGYLPSGGLAILGAREKSGKSTLVFSLVRALLQGADFLNQPTRQVECVLYLTEEAPASLQEKLYRLGLELDERLLLAPRGSRAGTWWDLCAQTKALVKERGVGLVVVDTLGYWAALRAEAENDAGAAQAAMAPLLELAGDGVAVLVLHHLRKDGAELRGSTAIAAAADVILTLRRDEGTRRVLEAVGRFDETPAAVLVEWDRRSGQYRALGEPAEVERQEAPAKVLEVLPSDGEGLTVKEVAEQAGLEESYAARLLRDLVREGHVSRSGAGTKAQPHRFTRSSGS